MMDIRSCREKGQGSMEYLMTLAWGILIVVIVGIVLWQLGILGGASNPNRASGFSSSKIGIIDNSIKCTTTKLTAIMTNQGGIYMSNIGVTSSSGYGGAVSGFGDTSELASGGWDMMNISTGELAFSLGDTVITDITITYDMISLETTTQRTQKGRIFCTVEP